MPTPLTMVDDEAVPALVDALADHHAATSGGGDVYTAQLSRQAPDAEQAARQAVTVFRQAATYAGLPPWPLTRLRGHHRSGTRYRPAAPPIPQLVGISDIAELLDVSKQRAWALAHDRDDFPRPIMIVSAGPLWLREAVEAFDERWARKPGRPKKSA
ncbi:MAG: hypothetical protein M3O70_16480 [Actinomycetota bacterium]|nr:hypothetical protein [Actinomycetota bacterium]